MGLQKGQSILEVIVAMAIFSLIGAAMVSMVVGGFTALEQGGEHTQAEALVQEGIEAVRSIRDGAWNESIYNQSAVAISGGQWIFSGEETDETIGQYTRTITFSDVCRDASDEITTCFGSYTDVHSKKVTVTVSWQIREGITNSAQRIAYLTNWDSKEWTQTGWSGGSGQSSWSDATKYDSDDGNIGNSTAGEIKLAEVAEGSWVLSGGTEVTHTSDTDFNAGITSDTVVSGTGDDAKIVLTQTSGWSEVSSDINKDINVVKAVSASDIWAGGTDGKITHYNGSAWSEASSDINKDIYDMEVVSSSDIWAGGKDGKLTHYNGTSWSEVSSDINKNINDIVAISASDIWAVANNGKITHYNGSTWSEVSSDINKDINVVKAVSASDIWAGGTDGKITHYNGSAWSEVSSDINKDIYDIEVIASNDIWAAGKDGKITHYNGTSWSEVSSDINKNINDLEAISSSDIWAVGVDGKITHYNGSSWSEVSSDVNKDINVIKAVSASDIWAAGKDGKITYYNGSSWGEVSSDINKDIYDMVIISSSDIWASGKDGKITHYGNFYNSSGTFTSSVIDSGDASTVWNMVSWTETLPAGSDVTIATRTGNTETPDESWSNFSGELTDPLDSTITFPDAQYLQYRVTFTRGTSPTETPELADITIIYNAPTTNTLNDLSIVAASNIWVVGKNGTIIHYDGSSWSAVTSPTSEELQGVHVRTANDGWAVEKKGMILHYNGSSWTEHADTGNEDWRAVFAIASDDVWVVGKGGKLAHYDGISWAESDAPNNRDLNGVYAVTTDDIWAVGKNGEIIHYDGVSWTSVSSPTGEELHNVFMLSASNGWAVGKKGVILQYNGTGWSVHTDTGDEDWYSIYLINSSDGWAVGKDGYIHRWNGSSWSSFTSPTTKDLNGAEMVSLTTGWAVGKDGTIIRFSRDALYVTSGYLISSVFNIGDASPVQVIEWDETLPFCSPVCEIKFQIQTAPDDSGSPGAWSATWSGPDGEDGDETDYFTSATGQLIHTDHNGDQWVRYKATLSGDGTDTPVLEEVRINYK